jgi:hypothetical protein
VLHVCGHEYRTRNVKGVNWGRVHEGYESFKCGEGGLSALMRMFEAWIWRWA